MTRFILFISLLSICTSISSQTKSEIIQKTIIENQDASKFDSISKLLGYKGGDEIRVSTLFVINEEGNIENIRARAPHSIFEQEATRILKKLPQLTPAQINGKPTRQSFAMPITFVIETDRQKKKRIKREQKENEKLLKN
ncbi:MAG: energy transducer TonB [Maribacter sp.]|nr:energy transducer TonB [Maribacter sp.]